VFEGQELMAGFWFLAPIEIEFIHLLNFFEFKDCC
jgi:hypothetical protein